MTFAIFNEFYDFSRSGKQKPFSMTFPGRGNPVHIFCSLFISLFIFMLAHERISCSLDWLLSITSPGFSYLPQVCNKVLSPHVLFFLSPTAQRCGLSDRSWLSVWVARHRLSLCSRRTHFIPWTFQPQVVHCLKYAAWYRECCRQNSSNFVPFLRIHSGQIDSW